MVIYRRAIAARLIRCIAFGGLVLAQPSQGQDINRQMVNVLDKPQSHFLADSAIRTEPLLTLQSRGVLKILAAPEPASVRKTDEFAPPVTLQRPTNLSWQADMVNEPMLAFSPRTTK